MTASASAPSAWESVEYTLAKHYYNPDIQAARAVYSAAAIHSYGTRPPVWMMVIGPPGSMKTRLLEGLEGVAGVHPIDILTPKTFLSGQIGASRKGPSPSLLHRIGPKGIITFPDFSTILGMRWDDCNTIFSQCRRIFDGRLTKEVGTVDGDTEWQGHITFLAACTNGIERYQQQMKGLGERFTQVVVPRGSRRAARASIEQNNASCTEELQTAVRNVLGALPRAVPGILANHADRISSLAEFTAFARAPVHRDAQKKIDAIIEVETPTRIAQTLTQIGKGSAALDGRDCINESDYDLMVRCAFDSIPEARRIYLRWIISGDMRKREYLTIRGTVLSQVKEELSELGVAEGEMLTEEFQMLLDESRVTTLNCRRPESEKRFGAGYAQ